MKKISLLFCLLFTFFFFSYGQNKKAEKDSTARVQFEKAVAALEANNFVIIVDSYETSGGVFETNTDVANFLSYEKEFVFLQGQMITGNAHTNKLTVSEQNQTTDKKGNVKLTLQVRGSFIHAKIEISLKKGSNYGDVIITPTKGDIKRFSGEITPRSESGYFKRSGEV
jgi:hypothetical protein